MNTIKSLVAVLALGLTSQAYAFQGPGHPNKEALDTNGDGAISREEIAAAKAAHFATADSDGNGSLSSQELEAFFESRRAEHQARKFEKLDADNSGSVSQAEFVSLRPGDSEQVSRNIFAVIDSNDDGQVTLEELSNRGENRSALHFARKDVDGNGVISADEFAKMNKSKRHMRRGH